MKFPSLGFLSPPAYLTMPMLGVDISDNSLRYVLFSVNSHKIKNGRDLLSWGEIPIPPGVITRGEVIDLPQLVTILERCRSLSGVELVNVSLSEERVYIFETTVKRDTPDRELRSLLEFKLEENVPVPSQDIYFDYNIINKKSDDEEVGVLVTAYTKEVIDQYYEAYRAAGFYPVSFEIEAQAIARSTVPKDVSGAVMLVDFGKTRTGLGIVSQGLLLHTSTIDIGGDQLSAAMRKIVGSETDENRLTTLKNTQGLICTHDSCEVYDATLGLVSVIKDEIATRIQYWHERHVQQADRRISKILLCGGGSNLRGLPAYLTRTLGIPVTVANVWGNAFSFDHSIPPIDQPHSLSYATAVGLALRSSI